MATMVPSRTRRQRNDADEAIIRALFTEHGRAMLGYATSLTNDRSAAEDVVQEALVRAWRNPDALVNGKGSVRGWLLTVVRNIVIDRSRARQSRPAEVRESPAHEPVEPDHADRVTQRLELMGALERLPAHHRDVLECVYVLGHTVNETAEKLGVPPGTVKSRAHHALRTLRESTFRKEVQSNEG
ncbi:RNA polymerase sigma factor SigL [Hoyosella subflava DQS3-9A1]|uniref:RNA polymerase sigma factor SigL n=2 Tax=Hoyosella TaxID=697025 RepID=F6EGF9_HOYSD|nr:RNA polymerase sigma factor SigL [Hoyosella subflava DQS3-9A1]